LKRTITPCQYGGDPDCTQCGCLASVGLKALSDYRIAGVLPLEHIFNSSLAVGEGVRKVRGNGTPRSATSNRAAAIDSSAKA
jgi:hypothetical protein